MQVAHGIVDAAVEVHEGDGVKLFLAGEATRALAGNAAGWVVGAGGEAPLAPGVVAEPLQHHAVLVGDDADRAEMIGVEITRRDGLGGDVSYPHADLGVADRKIIGPARRSGTGAKQFGADAERVDVQRGAVRMLNGQDAKGLFTESAYDGNGTSFWGRVDIGSSASNEIWEIKPSNPAGYFMARVAAEFYSITAAGPVQYQPGGALPLPVEPLVGQRGSYTYANARDGAILWSPYKSATEGVSLSSVTQGGAFLPPWSAGSLLLR
jgi:hypothetical protein